MLDNLNHRTSTPEKDALLLPRRAGVTSFWVREENEDGIFLSQNIWI